MTDNQLLRNIGGIKAEPRTLHLLRIGIPLREQQTSRGVIQLSRATLLESNDNVLSGYVVTFNEESYTFQHGKNAQRKFERLIDRVIFNR